MTYACKRDGNKCHFHANVNEFCVKRVIASILDYDDESAHAALAHFTMFYLNK